MAERYLPFCYSEDCPVELPNLGEDYAPVYGYAQTHQTLEQWLNIWRALADDIVQKGTATKIRRFIDLPTSFWNKCMGNVDTLRHVIRGARAKRGPDSGPGSLLWFVLIDYVLYQAFCHYQHAQIEGKLDNFYSFKQLHNDRKKIVSYRAYLTKLLDALSPANLETYFPGIRQQIDMMIGSQRRTRAVALKSDQVSQLASISTAKTLETSDSKNDVKYGLIMQFLTPESELFKKRLDVTLNHIRCKSKKKSEGKVARRNRGHCVVCCENCDERSSNPGGKCKGIHGRKTVSYCAVCGVYVCHNCWDSFHLDEVPNLPPCMEKKLGLARRRILRYDNAPKKQTRSPVRAMRPTRNSSSLYSPSKASSRARYIGQKLLERQANKPDRLTAESP